MSIVNQQQAVALANQLGLKACEQDFVSLGKFGYGPRYERGKYNVKEYQTEDVIEWVQDRLEWLQAQHEDAA